MTTRFDADFPSASEVITMWGESSLLLRILVTWMGLTIYCYALELVLYLRHDSHRAFENYSR